MLLLLVFCDRVLLSLPSVGGVLFLLSSSFHSLPPSPSNDSQIEAWLDTCCGALLASCVCVIGVGQVLSSLCITNSLFGVEVGT